MDNEHGHSHGQHQHGHGHEDTGGMAELLDLDAEVLGAYLSGVVDWVAELAGDPAPRRILDVGTGSGTGMIALTRRFPAAEVTALDISAPMLAHLLAKAREHGVADRVHPVEAGLDAAWPAVGPVDLAWAANSLHHMADPDRALAELLAAIRPGGLLAVAELDSFPRFLPDDIGIGRPGLEARAHALMTVARGADMPHMGSDWGPRLAKAGFTIEADRQFVIDLTAPLPEATGRYAQASLSRMRAGLDTMDADDLAALDTLTGDGPGSVRHRDDLTVRAARTVWVATRP